MINPFFQHFGFKSEQALVQRLISESIRIYGHNVYYLPRTVVKDDVLFGEDVLSKFENAIPLEVYVKDVQGFSGEGDVIARFGLQIRDEIVFTVSRKRWREVRTEKILNELGSNMLTEDTDEDVYELSEEQNGGAIMTEGDRYEVSASRPLEGDLIFFPLVGKIFEVRFVEHEAVFYQTGKLQTFDVTCELWDYSSERMETNDDFINNKANDFSLDVLENDLFGDVMTTENDGSVSTEGDGAIRNESINIDNVEPQSETEHIKKESMNVLDLSGSNPFIV